MKAVSNTTPLRYLIAIEQEHLLGQLFEKVFVSVAVHEELTDSRTPETVRRRVLSLPAWFEVAVPGQKLHRRRSHVVKLGCCNIVTEIILARDNPCLCSER